MRTIVLGIVLPLALAAGFLGGIVGLGAAATEDLRRHGHGSLAFADLRCDVPEPLSRADFLREVQYEAGIPDRIDMLSEGWQQRLRTAFCRSAWVEDVSFVGRISNPSHNSPEIRVSLRFRQPVLAVKTPEGLRAVDRHQVMLPRAMPLDGLPTLRLADSIPTVPSGAKVNDPDVSAAMRTLAVLPPAMSADLAIVKVSAGDVTLWTASGTRIAWVPLERPLLVQVSSTERGDQ